ncbi:LAETG motif-containing sortase-dependent surface protein [Streptomyces sp. NPDC006879]|uniref:LAETG motif-containing sortase-dependent surface protein n=1 Tax=Streptomyces sp. NPDC006879 TaxID=3364767 RepID=UPI003694D971
MFSAPVARSACQSLRLSATRAGAVLSVVGLAALGPAGGAAADAARSAEGASATAEGMKVFGQAVLHGTDGDLRIPAGLYDMHVEGGGSLQTYGIRVRQPAQQEVRYAETPWARASGSTSSTRKALGRAAWVLRHSYPQVNDLRELARAAGSGPLSEEAAAAGTQVAIWRLVDGADVEAVDKAAEKLADHLQARAKYLPEPPPSLTLTGLPAPARAGASTGPLLLHTGAQEVTLSLDPEAVESGVKIVGKGGGELTQAGGGAQLYVHVPEGTPAGTARLTAQAAAQVPVGRLFTSEGEEATSGALPQILAGSSVATVTATLTVTWVGEDAVGELAQNTGGLHPMTVASPSPAPDNLADTGSSSATPVIAFVAVGLVVLGGAVVFLLRPRPNPEDEAVG